MGRPALSNEKMTVVRASAIESLVSLYESATPITMPNLAKPLGLTAMALYRYFPAGKEEIMANARAWAFDQLSNSLRESFLAGSARSPITKIKDLASCACKFAQENPQRYLLMYTESQPEWESRDPVKTSRKSAWEIVITAFSEAQNAGFKSGHGTLTPHIFVSSIHGLIMYDLMNEPYAERRAETLLGPVVETVLKGIYDLDIGEHI